MNRAKLIKLIEDSNKEAEKEEAAGNDDVTYCFEEECLEVLDNASKIDDIDIYLLVKAQEELKKLMKIANSVCVEYAFPKKCKKLVKSIDNVAYHYFEIEDSIFDNFKHLKQIILNLQNIIKEEGE